MERRFSCLAISARNPQRRPVFSFRGQPPRADEGNADGSGATFQASTVEESQSRTLPGRESGAERLELQGLAIILRGIHVLDRPGVLDGELDDGVRERPPEMPEAFAGRDLADRREELPADERGMAAA